ncbi:MAG: protein translocase subunit SecF [Chloroflexia bacterium]
MIDLVSKRYLFLLASVIIIVPGLLAVLFGGLKPGIDFTGGTRWTVVPLNAGANSTERFKQVLSEAGIPDALVKGGSIGTAPGLITNTITMDLPGQVQGEEREKVETALINANLVPRERITETQTLRPTATAVSSTPVSGTTTLTTSGTVTGTATLTTTGTITGTTATAVTTPQAPPTQTEVRDRIPESATIDFLAIGPTIGSELLGRAFLAIAAASLAILIYLTIVFRKVPNAFRYGVCAIIALLHDVLVVIGVFAILGILFGIEIDALFITAMLTVIGFSVHDTIVVFDRVRENILKRRFDNFGDVVNYSLVQTLARSINTSITVVLTLFALYLLGGASIHNFVLALLIGIISGTYSSIFNASMLLVIWENGEWRRLLGRGGPPAGPTPRAAAR